ncbi:hypothetical protein PR202_gn00016 [Eleusine coracana subsp. coracana]|uniref:Plant bHLH transcription factor ACT-like domain-containing protein n=1 Tax=Eleusine coracana subsp. coracana TaxID=191504 RepID=A0AAV5F9F1_ELECO|nr:hypothetical protein PR202_gb20108 [Eleusine coracana subsp. coracana]GJN40723.1 hypothetical protein PR202_gn00016 [Eleusine coracana subsp. coracana]
MDKASILSSATSYVKELKENLKAQEAADSGIRSINNTVILINKKPCHGTPVARNTLPDVEVLFSGKSIMVKIHCDNGKGVIVKVLTEVEKLHLGIIDANVMAFSASTLIITITARASPPYLLFLKRVQNLTTQVLEGFTTVTAEEIIGRLNSALSDSTIA